VLRRCNGPQTLSGGHKVFVERLLLFLLGSLLLCLLRFLGHVALHDPQGWLNASRHSTRMHSEYTTIAKLILRASKKVSARHSVATRRGIRPRVGRKRFNTQETHKSPPHLGGQRRAFYLLPENPEQSGDVIAVATTDVIKVVR
jgi:hypothetical protein